jgi:protein TonB
MLLKKNRKYEYHKNSTLFFSLGLLCMSIFAYFAIEMQVEQKKFSEIITQSNETIVEEEPIHYVPKTEVFVPVKKVQFENDFVIVKKETEPIEIVNDPVNNNQIVKIDVKPDEPKPNVVFIPTDDTPDEVPFPLIESTPVFPGCENLSKEERDVCFRENVIKHIQRNLKYPENALENDHHGRINVQFLIEKDGTISIANIRGPYESLNKEAARVIKLLPKMKPGEQRNKPVKVSYIIPIVFKAQN